MEGKTQTRQGVREGEGGDKKAKAGRKKLTQEGNKGGKGRVGEKGRNKIK